MIRPTFLGFETAKRGLTAAQKGIDIAGHNLTNWDSAGYTRQRVTQVAVAPDSYRSRLIGDRSGFAGQGVDVTGITQIRDTFLDKRYRDEASDLGYFNQASTVLNDIQSSINEYDPKNDAGLRGRFMALSNALQEFSLNAYSETHANIVATEFKNLTQTLWQLSSKLDASREQQVYDTEVSVQEINKKLNQLAGLNQAIMEDAAITQKSEYFGPNELLDQRNLLLDELSQYVDISYTTMPDTTVTVKINGHVAVEGTKFDKMEMSVDEKTDVVGVRWISSNRPVDLTSGSLKANIDFLNGRGNTLVNQGETNKMGYFYYKDRLDYLAETVASVANRAIPMTDENGNIIKNGDEIVYKKLLGGLSSELGADGRYHVDDSIKITASNISLSDEWTEDYSYVIFQKGEGDVPDNVGNYAQALMEAITEKPQVFGPESDRFTGSFLDYIKGYATTLAEDISFHENRETAVSTISSTLEDTRDGVSGVVVDEEVSNIMMYQKSLSAASRLMTVMDEALDLIINKMGLVGR